MLMLRGREFGAWLATIARNLVADRFASSCFWLKVTIGELLDAEDLEPSPEETVLLALLTAELHQALMDLPEPIREAVWLWALGLDIPATANGWASAAIPPASTSTTSADDWRQPMPHEPQQPERAGLTTATPHRRSTAAHAATRRPGYSRPACSVPAP